MSQTLFADRRSGTDRRAQFRGGRRAADRVRLALTAGAMVGALAAPAGAQSSPGIGVSASPWGEGMSASKKKTPAPTPAPAPPPLPPIGTTAMRFGVHVDSLPKADSYSVPMNFGVFWMGSWTQKYGWGYAEQQLAAAKSRGITPIVHWWYWGDDISPDCVERGCQDMRQGVWKDRATWYRMTRELGAVIQKTMGGAEAIVIIESEFNKGGIESYEAFDGYLLDQIVELHRIAGIRTVVGFGNWGLSNWARFDRAASASDLVGTQLLRSSVRDSSTYQQAVDTLLSGATHLRNTFQKPSLIIDLALSSYPSAEYETYQESIVRQLFQRLSELRDAGVGGIVWRAIIDDASMDTSNYHGIAERYWGMVRADGSEKPAFRPFVDGIRAATAAALALR